MEGYLKVFVKRTFSLSTFETFWVVLDAQNLTYYANIDVTADVVGPLKDVVIVKSTKITKLRPKENGTAYGLKITSESGTQVALLDCDDPVVCNTWFLALSKAALMHKDIEDRENQPAKYCKILRIDTTSVTLSKSVISKAYKKLALQLHPDKGGDVSAFNEVNIAYNALMAIQAAEDEKKSTYPVDYEVVIERGPDGVGLGIVILEDKVKKQLVVQSVQENAPIRGITEEAEGSIRPGDVLIGIGKDDCSHWLLSRVKARLNVFRVPIGSQIRLTFERYLPKELDSEPEERSPPNSPIPERFAASPPPTSVNDQTPVPTEEEKTPEVDIDDKSPEHEDVGGISPPSSDDEYQSRVAPGPPSASPNRPLSWAGNASTVKAAWTPPRPVSMNTAQYSQTPPVNKSSSVDGNSKPDNLQNQPISSLPSVSPVYKSKGVVLPGGSAATESNTSNSIESDWKAKYDELRKENERTLRRMQMLEAENKAQQELIESKNAEIAKIRSHCDRQLAVSYKAADDARTEAAEMKDRAHAMVTLLRDKMVTYDPQKVADSTIAQKQTQLDLVSQIRKLAEKVIDAETRLVAVNRRNRELSQLIVQLRTSTADGSNRPDSEEILESAKDSFSAAYLLKKSKKYQARESKVEVLSSNLQSMLADLKSTLSDIDNM